MSSIAFVIEYVEGAPLLGPLALDRVVTCADQASGRITAIPSTVPRSPTAEQAETLHAKETDVASRRDFIGTTTGAAAMGRGSTSRRQHHRRAVSERRAEGSDSRRQARAYPSDCLVSGTLICAGAWGLGPAAYWFVAATGSTIRYSTRSNTLRRWLRRSSATVDADVVTTTRSRSGTTKMYWPPNPHA
jgi:hypothetical protein